MFNSARWRLTVWFTVVLGVILVAVGISIYFAARSELFGQVDNELETRAAPEKEFVESELARGRLNRIGPPFVAGGYFYAVLDPAGQPLVSTPNVDPTALPGAEALATAAFEGEGFVNTRSSEGDSLRVYALPVAGENGEQYFLAVGRSQEPEESALRRLLVVLIVAGGVGLILTPAAGYLLSSRALRPIQQAMDSQRAFVSDASHELRTPVTVIRSNAELLRRHADQTIDANKDAVDDILLESERLSTIVGQMLTLARLDSAPESGERSDVALDEIADEVVRAFRSVAREKEVALEMVPVPVRVRGDQARLRELLTIIVDNAIKYTKSGGKVVLELSPPSSGKTTIKVSDTGRGIPAEAIPHIFDRFYRVDGAHANGSEGTGLGLAIANRIVSSHGGSIRVDSKLGEGTSVTVDLPA